jgi:hypothetical protein
MPGEAVTVDVFGSAVPLPRDLVSELGAAAAAHAGVSSRHRDLSLVLTRALESGSATLSHGDLRALSAIAEEHPERFSQIVRELQEAARS